MKIFKNLLISTFLITTISLIACIVFNVLAKSGVNIYSFLTNIALGTFASSLLLMINSIIGYQIQKIKLLRQYHYVLLDIYNRQGVMEYEMEEDKESVGKSAPTEANTRLLYKYLSDITIGDSQKQIDINDDISFILPRGKLAKRFNCTNKRFIEYQSFMGLFRVNLHNHKNNPISIKYDYDFYTQKMCIIKDCLDEMSDILSSLNAFNKKAASEIDNYQRESYEDEINMNKTTVVNNEKDDNINCVIYDRHYYEQKNILCNHLFRINATGDEVLKDSTNSVIKHYIDQVFSKATNGDFFNLLLKNITTNEEINYVIQMIGFDNGENRIRITPNNLNSLIQGISEIIIKHNLQIVESRENGSKGE